MSESVLERSVLERKEREELQTIARAMGAEPPVRAKKADLVDLILTTAGISPGEGSSAPAAEVAPAPRRRTRRTEANGAALEAATVAVSADPDPDPDPAGTPGTPETDQVAEEEVPADTDVASAAPASSPGATTEDTPAEAPAEPADAGTNGWNATDGPGSGAAPSDEDTRQLPLDNHRDRAPREDPNGNESTGRKDGDTTTTGPDDRPPARDRDRENGRPREDRNRAPGQTPTPTGVDDDSEPGNRRRRRRGRDREGWREGGGREPASQPVVQRDGRPDEAFTGEPVAIAGLLDLRDEGYGFVRIKGYLPSKEDAYISVKQARQFGLRKGDHVTGASRPANRNEKNPALLRIDTVNGKDPEEARKRPRFEDLTPLFPDERLKLETPGATSDMTARIVDLISPIGKGQRGLIVSPPKAGKTTVLKQIVKSIEMNNPEVHLMVLLVDERPEEVTDMRRSTQGEVIASTFDRPSDEHTAVAELASERAKRLVEEGRDVVIVLDGITRLARAYNLAAPATGRIMSGGVDSGALYPPKRFFGSARNIEEGGSLTILATALIETGSKMDEVIFEEFKGTGNMELRLDRRLAERRIYPAIDVDASSTRHEELLFDRKQLQQVWRVRRALNALSSADGATPAVALERLMDGMRTFSSNEEFLAEAAKTGTATQ